MECHEAALPTADGRIREIICYKAHYGGADGPEGVQDLAGQLGVGQMLLSDCGSG